MILFCIPFSLYTYIVGYAKLTRDAGCYIAGLTFFQTLTGADISSITWAPEGTDAHAKEVSIEAASVAIKTPYAITPSRFAQH